MRYFGKPTDAPVYDGIDEAPTPVGRSCGYDCGRPIEEGDRGFLLPYLPSLETDAHGGAAVVGEQAWHRQCLMRNILGPDLGSLAVLDDDD